MDDAGFTTLVVGRRMRIEDEIVAWADTRTNWQRVAVRRILAGETLGVSDFEGIAQSASSCGMSRFAAGAR